MFMLATIITYPGDGGIGIALWALAPLTFAGAIIAFLAGLPILIVLGLPLTVPLEAWIMRKHKKALVVGCATGAVFGVLAGALFFGDKPSLIAAALCGSVYGLAWIFFYRSIVIDPAFEGAHNG